MDWQTLNAVSGSFKSFFRLSDVSGNGFVFMLLLLHVQIEELVVLVGLHYVVFLLVHYPSSEIHVPPLRPLLETSEVGLFEVGKDIKEQELLGNGKGMDFLNSKEAELRLNVVKHVVVAEVVFAEETVGEVVSF